MNQILDQLAKFPLTAKVAILALIVVGIGAFDYFVFYTPKAENLKTLQKKSADLNVKLVENQAIADNLPKFQEEVNILNEQLKQAVSLLPNEANVHDIYRQFSIVGKKTNVDVLSFRPGAVNRRGFYSEIDMELKVKGTFHDLATFLDQVGKLARIINIQDIVFSQPQAAVGGASIVLNMDSKATTFMFEGGTQR
jgi:type IV pilus assembly protein PilO